MNPNIKQHIPLDTILQGNCIERMASLPSNSIDFLLTDPPYLVNYRDRSGRTIQNDSNSDWLEPAMRRAYRVLKQDHLAVVFYGWTKVDKFFVAWKNAGFRPVGHIVFRKQYSSNATFLQYRHEQAYLLAKGSPTLPSHPVADVIDIPYTGNKLHPTQKPVAALMSLIRSFTRNEELVLDPFAGSGSTCAAALLCGRHYLGIELDSIYSARAEERMSRIRARVAQRSTVSSFPQYAAISDNNS